MKAPKITERGKIWLSVAAVFAAGAFLVNAIWVYSYNEVDRRHVAQINETVAFYEDKLKRKESSHKRAMGEMRNRVEKKVDLIIEKLDKMPPSPIIINARREIESVKNEP